MSPPSRRDFVKAAAAAAGATLLPSTIHGRSLDRAFGALQPHAVEEHGWERVPSILARIKPPVFPDRDYPITRYGAIGDGVHDCTDAFRQAIAMARRVAPELAVD